MSTNLRKNYNRKPDAAESNAGDDFHVLWSIRKSLGLLNFDCNGVKAVAVEGLTSIDEDPLSDDTLLAVDLTEYYGGEDFATAAKVVVSQLKYSTRHADKAWTVATICTGKKHAWKGSLLHRLATFYKGFCKDKPQDVVLQKLVIKLVSNRPVADELQNALTAIQQYLLSKPATTVLKLVLNEIDGQFTVSIRRMADSSGLSDKEFLRFIRILDLSDCSVGSRLYQEQQLIQSILELGSYKTEDDFNRLYKLIHRKMMPEARGRNTIRQVDILYQFELSDIRDLFPVEARFQNRDRLFEREQIPFIISSIQSASDSKMILHAGAGMGKSSIAQMLSKQLPSGSISLLFDCYGAGTYLDSDDKRHKSENAFLQLSNELALVAGTPLLLIRGLRRDIYVRELKKRLDLAAQIIRQINTEAIVLLVVDAADNSIHAAEQAGDVSFVDDLIRMSVPKGCRLLVTSRTGRIDSIPLSDEIDKREVNSFTLPETEQFLKLNSITVSSKEAEEFRQLTWATPRVMSYALSIPGDSLSEKLKPLKPGGKKLNDIFKLRIKEAQRRYGGSIAINDFLHYLISLPRPVPLTYVQTLSGLSDVLLQDIQTDLWQGIIFQNNQFSFRDEDFENFLRSIFPSNPDKLNAISGAFLAAAENDEYASLHLGNALRLAGKGKDLINIVLEGKFQHYPKDPIRLKEVVVERTRMAMEFSVSVQNSVDLVKLQMVAAEAAKTNTVLERILLNNAELASAFGYSAMAQKLYFRSGNPEWFGPVHFRSAAIHSRNVTTHPLAKEHLKKGSDWLRYRDTLSKEELENYRIHEIDLAYSAEAILRLSGSKACAAWLDSWTPLTFVVKAIRLLLKNLTEQGEHKQLIKWLEPLKLPIDIKLLVTQTFFSQGWKPPFSLEEMVTYLTKMKRLSKGKNFSMAGELMDFCEYAVIHKVDHEQVKRWLELIHYEKPQYLPSFYDQPYSSLDHEKDDVDIMFRKECLLSYLNAYSLTVSQFYPDSLLVEESSASERSKRSHEEEKGKFNRLYKHILPVYLTRSAFLFKTTTPSLLKKQLQQVITAVERDYELTYRFERQLPYLFRFLCIRLLDIAFFSKDISLIPILEKGFTMSRQNNTALYLAMADRLSSTKMYHPIVLQLLQKVEESIQKDTLSGSDQLDYFTKATIIGSRISSTIGQLYFDKMVDTADEIDEEGLKQIKALSAFILSEERWQQPKLAYEYSRFIEHCHLHLQREHFPWTDAMNGVARLCPATSMSVLCRWDHRDVQDYYKNLNEVLEEAVKQKYIDHKIAAALLPLNQYYWPGLMKLYKSILQGFDNEQNYTGKERFVQNCVHDLQLYYVRDDLLEILQTFENFIKNGKFLSSKIVEDFKTYHKLVGELIQIREDSPKKSIGLKKAPRRTGRKHSFKKVDLTNTESISTIFKRKENKDGYGNFNAEDIFEQMRQCVDANNYTKHLSALLLLDADLMNFWSYRRGFLSTLKEWEYHPEVKIWKQDSFFSFLEHHFTHFISFDHFNTTDLSECTSVFEITPAQLSDYLQKIIPGYLDELSASVLFELLPLTSTGLDKNEKEKLLQWILPRWNQKIKPDIGDGPWAEKYLPAINVQDTVAYFIRYFLAHPNKHNRWRAAHSLRRFVGFGKVDIIDSILPLLNQTHNNHFQDHNFLFYWLSAKLYFWIAMERISKEYVTVLLPYSGIFLSELRNSETPHTLVRHFIKSICNQVIIQSPAHYTEADKLFIQSVNTKPGAKQRSHRYSASVSERKTRFHFDTTDTIPYWYSSIIRSIGCSLNTFLQTADEFISQQWGYVGDGYEMALARNDKWGSTSNGHGTEPVVERLRIYFEYHSMFCAAGRLLEHLKVPSKEEMEEYGWLEKWSLRWENFWLADFRDPVPLVPQFWRKRQTDGNWEFEIHLADFDRAIGLSTVQQSKCLVIHSTSRLYYGKDYEFTSVSSVLVAPNYASSLLRSLQTSHDLLNHMPFENEKEDQFDDENDEPFEKIPWIIECGSDRRSIDDNDELYNNIDKCRRLPGKLFQNWAHIQFSSDYRYSYVDDPQQFTTRLQVWNDNSDDEYYDSFSSKGSILEMKISSLLPFLKETNHCLLIGCDIERHKEYSNNRYEYYHPYTRFYLIYPNGRIETISGNYQLG